MNKLSAWNTRRGAIAVRLNDGFEAEHPRRQVHLNDGLGATPAIRSRSRDGSGGPTAAVSRRSFEAVQVVAHPTGSTLRHATSAYPQLRVVPPAERHNRWIAGKRASARLLHEHETLPWRHFPMMVPAGERRYRLRPPDVAARVLGGRLKVRLISFCWDKEPRQCDIAYETKRLLTEYVDDRPLRCFG